MTTPEVVWRRLSQAGPDLERCRGWLSQAERAEMDRFLRAADRDRYALARGTLREQASRRLGVAPEQVTVTRDRLGKPALADATGLACNVSHSGDVVAVAFAAAREIGVDVEAHRDGIDHLDVAAGFMTPGERAAIARARRDERAQMFFRQWCFKEALVKALGTGLTRDPARFEIRFGTGNPRPVFVGDGEDDIGKGWRLAALAVGEGYSGALAWR
jgi:4'-phosphopantetheinyl transferase